jgi:hypothetical protein
VFAADETKAQQGPAVGLRIILVNELFKAVAIQLLQQLSAIAIEPNPIALSAWGFAPLKQWHCWLVNRASAPLKPNSHRPNSPGDGPMACPGELE